MKYEFSGQTDNVPSMFPVTGVSMAGPLILNAAPTEVLHAVNKEYVDLVLDELSIAAVALRGKLV